MAHVRVLLAATLVAMVAVVASPAPPASAQSCTDPFTAGLRQQVADAFPGQRVTASVHDTRTGCWYDLHPEVRIQTASVIKAQFLAGALLRSQDEGRGLTPWERARIQPTMWYSHNPPASELFLSLGGVSGQERLDGRFGLTDTSSTNRWGATVSSARDRTRLALHLLHSGGPLDAFRRADAWGWMSRVHPTQTWGITAGVPEGWSVALKNGFYPTSGTPRWRIGSTGFVRHDASQQGYAITVMSDQNPDHATGQRLVETVARQVAEVLTDGPPAPRPVDRSRCLATTSGQSWAQVAAALGTGDAEGVRIVSGGPPSPLAGMRACRPDLAPPPYDPDGPTAHWVRALFQTFLGRAASEEDTRHHTQLVEGGTLDRLGLALALARSDEWLVDAITDLYRAALDRDPDPAGLDHWTTRIQGGTRLTDVVVALYGSDERYRRSGGTDEAYVADLYRRILGREGDAGGRDHWVGQLAAGRSRGEVVHALHSSTESRRQRVERAYQHVLGRPPDAGGLDHWSRALLQRDDVELVAVLATSREYRDAAQP